MFIRNQVFLLLQREKYKVKKVNKNPVISNLNWQISMNSSFPKMCAFPSLVHWKGPSVMGLPKCPVVSKRHFLLSGTKDPCNNNWFCSGARCTQGEPMMSYCLEQESANYRLGRICPLLVPVWPWHVNTTWTSAHPVFWERGHAHPAVLAQPLCTTRAELSSWTREKSLK